MTEAVNSVVENSYMIQIVIQAGIALLTSAATLFGGYLIYGPKLRIEQKSNFQKEIGEKKAEALIEFKELIRDSESFEIMEDSLYDDKEEVILKVNGINAAIYPAFMEDEGTFFAFLDTVRELRLKEMYLDCEAAAYLIYFYKYLYELQNYKGLYYPHIDYPTMGGIIISDVQEWGEKADSIVIRDINEAKTNMESHKDNRWYRIRDNVYNMLYEKSMLKLLQTDPERLNESGKNKQLFAKAILDERQESIIQGCKCNRGKRENKKAPC